MIGAMIQAGDVVIMRPVREPKLLKEGTIIAARVEGEGTTLKYYHRKANKIILKPANPDYREMEYPATEVDIQGELIAVWRGYK